MYPSEEGGVECLCGAVHGEGEGVSRRRLPLLPTHSLLLQTPLHSSRLRRLMYRACLTPCLYTLLSRSRFHYAPPSLR